MRENAVSSAGSGPAKQAKAGKARSVLAPTREPTAHDAITVAIAHQPTTDWILGAHLHAEIILPFDTAVGEVIWPPNSPRKEERSFGVRDLCVIGARCPHALRWSQAGNVAIIRVTRHILGEYPTAPTNTIEVHDFATLAKGDIALWGIATALRDVTTTPAKHPTPYLNALGVLLAAHVFNAPHRNGRRPTGGNTLSPIQLKLVADYVEAHLSENFPVEKIAALVGLSTCHFIRKFKSTTGLSPHKFVIRARVERAHDYLRTGNFRVADAALEVGFCDQSHLDRYFRRYYGFAPSELLKQRHSQF